MTLIYGASFGITFEKSPALSEFLSLTKEQKLDSVEIIAEAPHIILDKIEQSDRLRTKEQAEELGIDLTIHATFSDLNLASLNDNVRLLAISEIRKCIDYAKDIGAKIVTIHPGDYGATGGHFPKKALQKHLLSLEALADYAEEKKIILGLENMPILSLNQFRSNYSPDGIANLVVKINSPFLQITWDVGHSNTTNYSLRDFQKAYQEHLCHIHIHDNAGPGPGWTDTHMQVGKGSVDWKLFGELIKEIDYSGILNFELSSWEKIITSKKILESIL
jgi:sugar phosphate isomerase/epimerase